MEDDILLMLVQERLVKKFGYEVNGTTCECEAACRMIKLHKPDVILMDINLEGDIEGTEVIESIRKEGILTPVIFLSGEKQSFDTSRANVLHCSDFL